MKDGKRARWLCVRSLVRVRGRSCSPASGRMPAHALASERLVLSSVTIDVSSTANLHAPALCWVLAPSSRRRETGALVARSSWQCAMRDRSAIAVRSQPCIKFALQQATSPAETPTLVPTAREAIGRPLLAALSDVSPPSTFTYGTTMILIVGRVCSFACE